MKSLGDNRWLVTKPTPIQIGKPANPPTLEALGALREAVSSSGAQLIYCFWLSIDGDQPHLGLGVAPNDGAVVSAVGRAVEDVWKRFSPSNQVIDVIRLGDQSLDEAILREGTLLFRRSSE